MKDDCTAARIRQLRSQAHMTQEELASLLDINRVTVSNYESGLSNPSYAVILKMADIFDVSSDYLLGRTDELPPHHKQIDEKKSNAEKLYERRSVGAKIVAIRRSRGISRNKLACMAGISQQGLRSIETGAVFPREETLTQLAAALGMSVSSLLDESQKEAAQLDSFMEELRDAITQLSPEERALVLQIAHAFASNASQKP